MSRLITPEEWWAALPVKPPTGAPNEELAAYHEALMAYMEGSIKQRVLTHEFVELKVSDRLTCFVSARAATVGTHRIRVSALSQYRMARALGAWLPTKALADKIYQLAETKIPAIPLNDGKGGPAPDMAYPSAWERSDDAILATGVQPVGLCDEGLKDWTTCPSWTATKSVNYGMRKADGTVYQNLGTAHDQFHFDYSQVLRVVAEQVLLDGVLAPFEDVLAGLYGSDVAKLIGGVMATPVPPWPEVTP
jgi:hypothetical protein